MSEADPIPPTSSVTALRIPMIKKGEYDLWSMKMRQYIAITDHILWDIITNGDQATTDPASSSAPKTSLAANARRNNEKALNILLSAIPDRHLLSFHDAVDAKSLWTAIKARFGGNEASKKMQKNLLKQQFETFTIGSREELDSAYERFQNILSMLELYDAKVSNVIGRLLICSNKFDEKVKRARMFVEEYTYVLGRVHMCFGRPILRILEGWQRARIARLSDLHSRTHNRSPPATFVQSWKLKGWQRLPLADVGDIAYAFDVLYTCDKDTYEVVHSCQVKKGTVYGRVMPLKMRVCSLAGAE
ncbi:hypothetical protein Tco_0659129 [Tanacetum coccineum]